MDEYRKKDCAVIKCKNGGRNNKTDMIHFNSCDHYVCFDCYADIIEGALMGLKPAM